jgi:hypothetical protein
MLQTAAPSRPVLLRTPAAEFPAVAAPGGMPFGAWTVLRDCPLGGEGPVVPLALLHPGLGVALVEPRRQGATGAAGPARLRARLEAARFGAVYPGHLPILGIDTEVLADPAALRPALEAAFAAALPIALPGGGAWVAAVARALTATSPPPPAPSAPRRHASPARRGRRAGRAAWGLCGLAAAILALATMASDRVGPRDPGPVGETTRPAAKPVAGGSGSAHAEPADAVLPSPRVLGRVVPGLAASADPAALPSVSRVGDADADTEASAHAGVDALSPPARAVAVPAEPVAEEAVDDDPTAGDPVPLPLGSPGMDPRGASSPSAGAGPPATPRGAAAAAGPTPDAATADAAPQGYQPPAPPAVALRAPDAAAPPVLPAAPGTPTPIERVLPRRGMRAATAGGAPRSATDTRAAAEPQEPVLGADPPAPARPAGRTHRAAPARPPARVVAGPAADAGPGPAAVSPWAADEAERHQRLLERCRRVGAAVRSGALPPEDDLDFFDRRCRLG